MTYKILITDDLSPQGLEQLEEAEDVGFDIVKGLSPAGLAERIGVYDGLIVRSSTKVTEEVLAAAEKLKAVGRAGVGVDNINVDAASMRGVMVMNTPGANAIAAAEHTMALLLALCRNVSQACAKLKEGEWERKRFIGLQLYRKTIGIIGMGRVGTQVALRCQAFGMEVITYDPYLVDEVAEGLKVEPVELEELFVRSDFITLHAALIPETEKMIDAAAIEKMKDGVRIVNTARGDLIDEAALVEGLRSGKIAGAALDVYTQEPLSPESALLELENVVVTPHLAASTVEAQREVGTQVIEQMLDVLREEGYRNVINLPLVDTSVLKSLEPFLSLAEKVGSLQTQLANDAIERVEVGVKEDEGDSHLKPVTVAVLKGILEPVLHQPVNYVNARLLAQQRGITVSQASVTATDYPNLISCRVDWAGGSRTIAGTLFNQNEPRIVQIDGYRVDVRPEGVILVTYSHDRPGFIGQVGTILGQHGINIATWRTGRSKPGGLAISFVGVDNDIPDDVLTTVADIEMVRKVKKVKL